MCFRPLDNIKMPYILLNQQYVKWKCNVYHIYLEMELSLWQTNMYDNFEVDFHK